MTNTELRTLAAAAITGTPHADLAATLGMMRYLAGDHREHAIQCYAAIIGERALPRLVGALPAKRSARQRIEELQDERS